MLFVVRQLQYARRTIHRSDAIRLRTTAPQLHSTYDQRESLLDITQSSLASQAIPPIPTHFSMAWSVCLSVVCHIRSPCLNNCSTDLDAIWQVHSWCPMIQGKGPLGEGEVWWSNLSNTVSLSENWKARKNENNNLNVAQSGSTEDQRAGSKSELRLQRKADR